MFGSKDRPDDGSTRTTPGTDRPHGTTTDAAVTSRMTGTTPRHAATDRDGDGVVTDRDGDGVADRDGDGVADRDESGRHARLDRDRDRDRDGDGDVGVRDALPTSRRDAHAVLEERGVRPAKTSAAATFALVFGLSALFCALTGLLAPAAVVFGLIGLVLGVVGRKKGRLPGITGRSIATAGLVTALLGLLLGAAVLVGAAVVVNDEAQLDRVQGWIDDARADLPTADEIVEQVPGN